MQTSRVISTEVSLWTESRLYLELVDFLLHKAEEASGNSGFHKHHSGDASHSCLCTYMYSSHLRGLRRIQSHMHGIRWPSILYSQLRNLHTCVGGKCRIIKQLAMFIAGNNAENKEESSNFWRSSFPRHPFLQLPNTALASDRIIKAKEKRRRKK